MGACCESGEDIRPAVPTGSIAKPANQKIEIQYFPDAYGRPAPLVMLLSHKQIPYDYVTVSQEEWGQRKAAGNTGEFGGMPILTQNGKSRQQTNALLRQLGIQYGYYNPTDWKTAGMVDMLVDTWSDVFNSISKTLVFSPDEKKGEEMEAWKTGILTKYLTIIENQLASNAANKFITGNSLTIADFVLACLLFNIMKNEQSPVFQLCKPVLLEYPNFGAYSKRLESELSNYLNNREKYPF